MHGLRLSHAARQIIPQAGIGDDETAIAILAASSRLSQASGIVCRSESAPRSIADSKSTQVHGALPVHGLVGEHGQLEEDALEHRKPVQLTEHRCDSVVFLGPVTTRAA